MTDTIPTATQELARPIGLTVIRGAMRVLSATAPGVASRVAANLFMKPRRYPTPRREQSVLEGSTPFTVRVGASSTVRAWRFGEGPVVVLAHGWEGRGSQLAPFIEPLVARRHSVVTFDAPAHGASPGSRSSLPHFAWALRSVADACGSAHAIVAHSLGCAAATLALHDGLSVERLAFLAPPLNPVDYTARLPTSSGSTIRC